MKSAPGRGRRARPGGCSCSSLDGLVDETCPDDDGDGIADCLEVACRTLDVAVAGAIALDDVGVGVTPPVDDPWSYMVECGFTTSDVSRRSVAPREDIGSLGFAVTIDADSAVTECDETDNVYRWEDRFCP